MKLFHISGAMRDTGKDISVSLPGENREMAMGEASRRGILVSDATEIPEITHSPKHGRRRGFWVILGVLVAGSAVAIAGYAIKFSGTNSLSRSTLIGSAWTSATTAPSSTPDVDVSYDRFKDETTATAQIRVKKSPSANGSYVIGDDDDTDLSIQFSYIFSGKTVTKIPPHGIITEFFNRHLPETCEVSILINNNERISLTNASGIPIDDRMVGDLSIDDLYDIAYSRKVEFKAAALESTISPEGQKVVRHFLNDLGIK